MFEPKSALDTKLRFEFEPTTFGWLRSSTVEVHSHTTTAMSLDDQDYSFALDFSQVNQQAVKAQEKKPRLSFNFAEVNSLWLLDTTPLNFDKRISNSD